MNWYKKAQENIKPWQMTKKEYESMPYPPLKPNKIFYVNVYGKNIEVIQNPTGSDIRQMTKEVLSDFPKIPPGTPKLRSTQDKNNNKYYWKAYDAVHAHIEPLISKLVGAELNQNAARESYQMSVYHALKDRMPVPAHVFNEFAEQYPDIAREYSNELV